MYTKKLSLEDYKENIQDLLLKEKNNISTTLEVLLITLYTPTDIILFKDRWIGIMKIKKSGNERNKEFSRAKTELINNILTYNEELSINDIKIFFCFDKNNHILYQLEDVILGQSFYYKGKLQKGAPHGKGVAYYEDSSVFHGTFKEGKRHGLGTLKKPNGESYQSEWENGIEKSLSEAIKILSSLQNTALGEPLNELLLSISKLKPNKLLTEFLKEDLKRTGSIYSKLLESGVFRKEICTSPDEVQKLFLGYMNALVPGDEYFTITHLDFWSNRTLPHPRTFLHDNAVISKNRVRISRVIMLDRNYLDLDAEEKFILNAHAEESKKVNGLNTRIVELPDTHTLDRVGNIAVFKNSNGFELMIEMFYTPKNDKKRYLSRIDVVSKMNAIEAQYDRFSSWFDKGTEINNYLEKHALLTFELSGDKKHKKPQLRPIKNTEISDEDWKILAHHVSNEPALISYTAEELKERWEKQMAAICVDEKGIVSYTSLLNTYNTNRFRETFLQYGICPKDIPDCQLLEFQSGWTRPDMRRKKISMRLRIRLMNKHRVASSCFLSLTSGLSSAPIAVRLDWRLISWQKYKFISCLIGSFSQKSREYKNTYTNKSMELTGKSPHKDNTIKIEYDNIASIKDEFWSSHFFLWAEHKYILEELNEKLSDILNDNLDLWLKIIKSANHSKHNL